jgi:hypothetical protein
MDSALAGLDVFASVLPGFALKSSLVLAGAWAADRRCGRMPAASRHLLWAASLAGVVLLLVAELLLPAWTLPLLPSALPAAAGATGAGSQPGSWLAAGWLLFVALGLLRVAAGFIGVARLRSRAMDFDDPGLLADLRQVAAGLGLEGGEIRCRQVAGLPGPCIAGVFRPFLILPEDAPLWEGERRRLVLAHELAHLARRDLLWQAIGQVGAVLAFFQPLAWLALRRLREESERACDDQVLLLGAKASSYAAALLTSAGAAMPGRQLLAAGLGGRDALEVRLLAILAPGVRRRARGRRERALAALFLSALLPLAAIKAGAAKAAGPPAEISPPSPPDPLAPPEPADPVAPPDVPLPPD